MLIFSGRFLNLTMLLEFGYIDNQPSTGSMAAYLPCSDSAAAIKHTFQKGRVQIIYSDDVFLLLRSSFLLLQETKTTVWIEGACFDHRVLQLRTQFQLSVLDNVSVFKQEVFTALVATL